MNTGSYFSIPGSSVSIDLNPPTVGEGPEGSADPGRNLADMDIDLRL
jgi:hypothetical protein